MTVIDRITRRHWIGLGAVLLFSFLMLGFFGVEVYRQAPPIPEQVVADGRVVLTRDDILTGQQVWQSTGGQQLGSVWGHGAYQAPDWTADWLHREALALLEVWAEREDGTSFAALSGSKVLARISVTRRARSALWRSVPSAAKDVPSSRSAQTSSSASASRCSQSAVQSGAW